MKVSKRGLGTVLAGLLLVSGCASVNQAMNAKHASMGQAAPMDRAVQGAIPYEHVPWAVGQWIKVANRSGEVWSVQTLSIVAQDAQGFWLETETVSPQSDEPSRLRMHVTGYDPSNPESVKDLSIGTVYTQTGTSRPMQAPPFIGPMTSGWVLQNFKIDVASGHPDDVKAPAGSFSNAMTLHHAVSFGPFESEGKSWYHSEVPVWGIVKTVADDGDSESVLLDYGMTGAVSKMALP